jgi:DNA-binding FadR family transcriptional regulator
LPRTFKKQIAQGKLHPGDRLPSERNLCVALGVGRTTIREALKSLGVRGVVARKGRATVISDPQNILPAGLDLNGLAAQINIKQLYEVRKLLEVEIAGWAAMRATAKDIKCCAARWRPNMILQRQVRIALFIRPSPMRRITPRL